jgi:hypothetical protein
MADLNALIAQGAQFAAPADPFAQYGKMQQLEQGETANQLNRMKMDEYQRGLQEEVGLRNFLSGKTDFAKPENRAGLLQYGKTGRDYLKTLSEQDTAAANLANIKSQTSERDFGLKKKQLDYAWGAVGSASTPELAIQKVKEGLRDKHFDEQTANFQIEKLLKMTPEEFRNFRAESIIQILDAKDKLGFILPKTVRQDTGGEIISIQDNPALPGYGQRIKNIPSISKTPTFADISAQGQLKVSQDRLTNEQDPTVVAKQTVADDGTVTNFNKFGQVIGTVKGAGKASGTFAKAELQKKQLGKDLGLAISELSEVTKDGGLIDQSTGSYLGKAVDIGNRVFGRATEGDIAAGKLQPIADLALKMVPRFEGPQSNADTTSYKQAAGQLADTTLPTEIRKQAGREVLRIMKARKDQFVTSDMASGDVAVPSVAPPPGFTQD